jgi:hypothetical protein
MAFSAGGVQIEVQRHDESIAQEHELKLERPPRETPLAQKATTDVQIRPICPPPPDAEKLLTVRQPN